MSDQDDEDEYRRIATEDSERFWQKMDQDPYPFRGGPLEHAAMERPIDRIRRITGDGVADNCLRGIGRANHDISLYRNSCVYRSYVDWTAALVKDGFITRDDLPGAIEMALAMLDAEASPPPAESPA